MHPLSTTSTPLLKTSALLKVLMEKLVGVPWPSTTLVVKDAFPAIVPCLELVVRQNLVGLANVLKHFLRLFDVIGVLIVVGAEKFGI